MSEPSKLMKSSDVALMLGISQSALCRWRTAKKGPPYLDLEGNPRYRLEDIEIWLNRQTRLKEVA
ncbi:MAG: helix-turn-helix domain-containing protein [Homoserinimonas sp.]